MALFVLADLHLSTAEGMNKSMEVFGQRWQNYVERLETSWRAVVSPTDTVVIAGDISWALTPDEATSDLRLIDSLPGRKLIFKGNHDYWWNTKAKLNAFLLREHLGSIRFVQNEAVPVGDSLTVCGTRGWFHDRDAEGAKIPGVDYDKIVLREAIRLKMSLDDAQRFDTPERVREKVVFLHFPPAWGDGVCAPIVSVLEEYQVKRCFFGHIHGASPTTLTLKNTRATLVAADALGFVPLLVREEDPVTDAR